MAKKRGTAGPKGMKPHSGGGHKVRARGHARNIGKGMKGGGHGPHTDMSKMAGKSGGYRKVRV